VGISTPFESYALSLRSWDLNSDYCESRGPVGAAGAGLFAGNEEGCAAASASVEGGVTASGLAEGCATAAGRLAGFVIENSGIVDSGIENAGVEGSGTGLDGIENSGTKASGIVGVGIEKAGIFESGIEELGMENAGIEVVEEEIQSEGTSIPLESCSPYSDGLIDEGVRKLPLSAEGVIAAGAVRPEASPKSCAYAACPSAKIAVAKAIRITRMAAPPGAAPPCQAEMAAPQSSSVRLHNTFRGKRVNTKESRLNRHLRCSRRSGGSVQEG
jgi:hypothetical protein